MSKWATVYKTSMFFRAELVKAVLEDKGMQPVIVNKKDSNYHFGHFEVQVNPDFAIPAIKVIEDEIKFGEQD